MFGNKKYSLFFFLFIFSFQIFAAADSSSVSFFKPASSISKKRLYASTAITGVLYTSTVIGLNELWYKDYPRSSFHFFNDNDEWLQMDKAGHMVTSYYVGYIGLELCRWSGVDEKRSTLYGGMLGLLFQTSVEVLDGFSTGWGFSAGDMGANVLGTGLLISQQLGWHEQRMVLKASYHATFYAGVRPELLGGTNTERMMKDYNGQTLWASFNIKSLIFKKDSKFPAWLNVAIGYGAGGMIGASYNPYFTDDGTFYPRYDRYRKYLFSLDIDLTRIKTKSSFLQAAFKTIGFIKFPMPALEYSNGFYFRPLYF